MNSHRCKFDTQSPLPECPWASRNCHSPCDIIARGRRPAPAGVTGIETPDGQWPEPPTGKLLTKEEVEALAADARSGKYHPVRIR